MQNSANGSRKKSAGNGKGRKARPLEQVQILSLHLSGRMPCLVDPVFECFEDRSSRAAGGKGGRREISVLSFAFS